MGEVGCKLARVVLKNGPLCPSARHLQSFQVRLCLCPARPNRQFFLEPADAGSTVSLGRALGLSYFRVPACGEIPSTNEFLLVCCESEVVDPVVQEDLNQTE